jgi:hypothetical protein
MKPGALLVLASMVVAAGVACAADRLQGDPQAVASVEAMLERMGGREIWARTRSLHLEYRVWRTDPDETMTERAWRDLQEPNQRIEFDSPSEPVTWAFTPRSGWVSREGTVKEISAAGHASAVGFWPADFYTMIHRLAVADPGVVLAFVPPRRVRVDSAEGVELGWWEIDSSGQLLKWGSVSDGEQLEYVYGPLKTFGEISFPAWGSAVDGSWRFEYANVSVDPAPIPAPLLDRPG